MKVDMFYQPVKFIIIGLLNTAISFVIFYTCFKIFACSYLISLAVSYVIGILNSYIWNSRWTFQKKQTGIKQMIKFTVVYVFAFIINLLILIAAVELLRLNVLPSQVIALTTATMISFAGHKYWSFKNNSQTVSRNKKGLY